jgi:hypothetical protein
MSVHLGFGQHGALPRSVVGIGVALSVCAGTAWAVDAAGQSQQRVELQAVADRAALAAVNALVANASRGPASQTEAAITASDRMTGQIGDARSAVNSSAANLTAAVTLSATPRGRALGIVWRGTPINVIGKAGYLKPDQPASRPDEPVATVPESKVRDALSG